MTTETDIKLARYNKIETEGDAFGRVIGVRRLRPSEQTKVAGMTSDLIGSDELLNEDGVKVLIPHRMPLLITACVCMIDDVRLSFPRNRGELDAVFDRLDTEGLEAAGNALMRLNALEEPANQVEEAKNL